MTTALRITIEGDHTAFRQPWTQIGRLLTYPMPPPATVLGHIAAAWGGEIPADELAGLKIAYEFRCEGRGADQETYHSTKVTPPNRNNPNGGIEITPGPMEREFLSFWQLVLYINKPEWESLFSAPKNAVYLGRSGDLAEYTDVSVVEMGKSETAVFHYGAMLGRDFAATGAEGTLHLLPVWYDNPAQHQGRHIETLFFLSSAHVTADNGVEYPVDPTRINGAGQPAGVHWIDFANTAGF